jgi:excinuclease UvrABC nuclease subunit
MTASNVPQTPGAYKLLKNGSPIYVGSAVNLQQRYLDWVNDPHNPCVKRNGWETFQWQQTKSLDDARKLELHWYSQFNPMCNLVTPPGCA